MLQERIHRVINNHQLSCGHTSHYIFILKGFKDIIQSYTVPVEPYQQTELHTHKNFYILYEDALRLTEVQIKELMKFEYDPWVVDFNWFQPKNFVSSLNDVYNEVESLNDGYLIAYPEIEWVPDYKKISIFNTKNPATNISENLELTNIEKYQFFQDWMKKPK